MVTSGRGQTARGTWAWLKLANRPQHDLEEVIADFFLILIKSNYERQTNENLLTLLMVHIVLDYVFDCVCEKVQVAFAHMGFNFNIISF